MKNSYLIYLTVGFVLLFAGVANYSSSMASDKSWYVYIGLGVFFLCCSVFLKYRQVKTIEKIETSESRGGKLISLGLMLGGLSVFIWFASGGWGFAYSALLIAFAIPLFLVGLLRELKGPKINK